MSDNVKHPNHYCKSGGIECIEAIKSAVADITDPFEAYCTGNIIKYAWRWHDKNGVEDLHKAMQYIEFIEQHRANSHTTIAPEISTAVKQYPTVKISQAEYEQFFDSEECVCGATSVAKGEPVKGKYEGLSNRDLRIKICVGKRCRDCPLDFAHNSYGSCVDWSEDNLAEARALMLDYLNKQERLEGKA